MVLYITPLRWMSNLSLREAVWESHKKTWKKPGGNAQQCIQGYIVQPKIKKKAYRDNPTGTDNQRASECLIAPLPVLVVLVMVPWRDYTQWPSRLQAQWHWEAFPCTTITKCDKQVSEHAHTEPNWLKQEPSDKNTQKHKWLDVCNIRTPTETAEYPRFGISNLSPERSSSDSEKSKQANLFISWHSYKLTLKCCNQQ